MKNLLKYFCFLAFLYGLWRFVSGYFSFLLFLMTFCLICICLLFSIIPMRKSTISIKMQQAYCLRDETINLSFCRQSVTPIPCGQIIIEYQMIDAFSQIVAEKSVCLHDQQVDVEIPCPHCGHYTIQVQKIKCFDLLQCFSFSKTVSIQNSFDVMPHYHLVDVSVHQVHQLDEQGENYLTDQKGDDYSEIFEIRTYREGDELKHIHWNMSSKFQEFFVKVGSQPVHENLTLAMEYKENNTFYDLQFDYFYSLCISLLKENIAFEIVTSCDVQNMHVQSIHSVDNLATTIRWMMKNPIKTLDKSFMSRSFYQIKGQNLEVYHL